MYSICIFVILLFTVCDASASDIVSDGAYVLTSSLDAAITNTIKIVLRELREENANAPESLHGIRRILYSPDRYELRIQADLGWHGASICDLRLYEDHGGVMEINCGSRRWRAAVAQAESTEALSPWVDVDSGQWSRLERRIALALAQVQKQRGDPPLLLPIQIVSARRHQILASTRHIIEARLGIPAQNCELEIIERADGYKRLIVTCEHLHVDADSEKSRRSSD